MQKKHLLIIIILLSIISSCAPTKNTATRRFYHNLVSRYNIYFNGREAIRNGQTQIANNHKDDYTNIISIYKYGTEKEANSVIPLMDRAIEKGSKVVLKHSMSFQNVEYNKWVDDSYLLIGIAHFFKHDYLSSIEMFDFISKKFADNTIRYDALLWLAKSYMYSDRIQRCEDVFKSIEPAYQNRTTSKYVINNYPLVKAQYHINKNELEKATTYLEKAIKEKQSKAVKTRTSFIAGQVYQRIGNNEKALFHYSACLNMNPPYDLAFRAKIFSAECYDATAGSGNNILKELQKMLKESKNKYYFDEIYFALANIELKKNNIKKAIEYLQLSAKSSTNNDFQKGLSYRKLAEINFDLKEYEKSKLYYDSTILFLPKQHQDYYLIEEKANILKGLIENIQTIELQDSLQRLANMSEPERLAIIDGIIADIKKAEELEKQRERDRQISAIQQQQDPRDLLFSPNLGTWYFYNPPAVNYGKIEFEKVWGERKLEDIWRLSNKEIISFDDFDDYSNYEDQETLDSIAKINDPKERLYYLKDIPDTPEKINNSNNKIEIAHYNAGKIYFIQLKDHLPSIDMYEKLLKRFPETEYELEVLYSLYLSSTSTNQLEKKEKYKKLILSKYPNSDFANIISDPDYYKKIAQQSDKLKDFYKKTWLMLQDEKYYDVIENANIALKEYKDPYLLAKFEYLKAVSIAKTSSDKNLLIKQLKHIVEYYPESEVMPLAKNILNNIENPDLDNNITPKTIISETEKSIYKFSPEDIHLFVLIIDVKTANINNIRASFSDHNSKFFATSNLSISNLFLSDQRQIFTISRFENKELATKYYDIFKNNSDIISNIKNTNPKYFIISTENYSTFYKEKNENEYIEFFKNHY